MLDAEEVRNGIQEAAARRRKADEVRREATDDLVRWLSRAEEAGISHTQAARLAGLTRNGAYYLLDRL